MEQNIESADPLSFHQPIRRKLLDLLKSSFLSSACKILHRTIKTFLYMDWQLKLILICSLINTLLFNSFYQLWFSNSDPMDYYRFAKFILGQEGGLYIPWRTPGMSFYYILSGVTWLDTWVFFLIGYSLMSIFMPAFIYYGLRHFSKRLAFACSVIFIYTMLPFAFSRSFGNEHLFLFLNFAAMCFISIDIFHREIYKKMIIIIFFLCLSLTLVRPVAAMYFWVYLFVISWTKKYTVRTIVIAGLAYMAIMAAWCLFERDHGLQPFSTSYHPTTKAERRFGEAYFSGKNIINHDSPIINFASGIHSMEMLEAVAWYANTFPERWHDNKINKDYAYGLFGIYKHNPEVLVHKIFHEPNFIYFNFIIEAVKEKYNREYEKLLYSVASEQGTAGFIGVLNYFKKSPMSLLTGAIPYCMSSRNLLGIYYFTGVREYLGFNLFFKNMPITLIKESNGPYAKEFKKSLEFYTRNFPKNWEDSNRWYGRFKGQPENFIKEIFNPTNIMDTGMWESFYFEHLSKYHGLGPAAKLFKNTAKEAIMANPKSALLIVENLFNTVLIKQYNSIDDPWSFQTLKKQVLGPGFSVECINFLNAGKIQNTTDGLTPRLASKFSDYSYANEVTTMLSIFYGSFHMLTPILFILTLLLFPFTLFGKARLFSVFLVFIYCYNLLGVALYGNFGASRYYDVFAFIPVLIVCIGLTYAVSIFKHPKKLLVEDEHFG